MEIWKVASDITNPHAENNWTMKKEDGDGTTTDEQVIADQFNIFFSDKISNLKSKIDNEYKEDPLEKLKQKLENKKLKFEIKQVTTKQVNEALKKIKKKKSAGSDGLSQEHLAMGAEALTVPLTQIFNQSIEQGIYMSNSFINNYN